MLRSLSNKTHEVISSIALTTAHQQIIISDNTKVTFKKLSDKEKKDNLYNINKLSYTSDYMPEEDEEGKYDDKDGKKEK